MEDIKIHLSKFLKRRHAEIMIDAGRPVTIRELAQAGGFPENNLGRWMEGLNKPDPQYIPALADLFGDDVFKIMGYPKPMPKKLHKGLQWMIDHQDNPGVQHVLDQIEEQGEAILSHKPDKSDSVVRLVTFDPA